MDYKIGITKTEKTSEWNHGNKNKNTNSAKTKEEAFQECKAHSLGIIYL